MTLNEFLPTMGARKIRIGTKGGSGFIYAGGADECDLYELDVRIEAYLCTVRGSSKETIAERLREYVPLCEREVLETYESIRNPKTTIVIIAGKETEASVGGVEIEPIQYHGCVDDFAAGRLIGAIYSQVKDDMDTAYDRSECLMSWYNAKTCVDALEADIKRATCPGKGTQLINIKQMRLIMAEIKRWIDEGIQDAADLERWMMRETDPQINGHISNPSGFIKKVKEGNRATRIEKHYKSFREYTSTEDRS